MTAWLEESATPQENATPQGPTGKRKDCLRRRQQDLQFHWQFKQLAC